MEMSMDVKKASEKFVVPCLMMGMLVEVRPF